METRQLILTPEGAKEIEQQYRIVKRSVDARQRDLKVLLTVLVDAQGCMVPKDAPVPLYEAPVFQHVQDGGKGTVKIVGAGPAGLFAALTLLEHGYKPIIYERGKDVSSRKRDIALLNQNKGLNTESNYCFGEGGAGTFSDGKLFSRSKKRGNMQRVMELFHYFGADDNILYEAHAHIGSDKLSGIIRRMRECIVEHGGEVYFDTKWNIRNEDGKTPVILAIGHSAHDTYRELAAAGVQLEAKGCAMGVRVEHPQSLINRLMYHLKGKSDEQQRQLTALIGNAAYQLVTQVDGQGVYSFCMCPGGHIVPAGSDPDGCVVNGMSASHRNSPYANSGIVVELHPAGSALEALNYQEHLEHLAKAHGGTEAQAPAQRLKDFVEGKACKDLPSCSYLPGIVPSRLDEWLPREIGERLRQGFRDFDRKYPGFVTNDAVVVGVESRSSSPVRIVRNDAMQSVSHPWLYPCGEGAGYAGGITSSAMDGIRAANSICEAFQ